MCKEIDGLSPWEELEKHGAVYAKAINAHIDAVRGASGLDDKTFHLVWIALQTALDYDLAVKAHVPLALEAGAGIDEIIGAAAIACAAAGPKGFVKCHSVILKEYARYRRSEKESRQ